MRKYSSILTVLLFLVPILVLAQADGSIPTETPLPSIIDDFRATPATSSLDTTAQNGSVPRATATPLISTMVSPVPTPSPSPSVLSVPSAVVTAESNNFTSIIITVMASVITILGLIIYKAKIKSKEDDNGGRCDSIKELLEQKKRELEELMKKWPEDKLKEILQAKVTGELKKDEDARKILETAEKIKVKRDKLKEVIEMLQKKYDLCMLEFPFLERGIYKGTIVENSLIDKKILKDVKIERTYQDEDWILHDVFVNGERLEKLGKSLTDGPWYMNFWKEGKTDGIVIFKDKSFKINYSDKSTWIEALKYGRSIGIPEEQLDFSINYT